MPDPAEPQASAAPVVAVPLISRAALARVAPFATYMAFIVVADMLARAGVGAPALRWLYGVKIVAVMGVLAFFWRDYTELGPLRLRAASALLAIATGIVVLVLWLNLHAGWMVIGASAGFNPDDGGQLNWLLVSMRIFGAALVVPLMEELFWRSYLMRWIGAADFRLADPAAGLKGLVVTSILFGFEHDRWFAGILAGLAYGWLYMRHRSLWSPILAHAVTNGLLGAWVVATGSWGYW